MLELSSFHTHTAQCLLSQNIVIEKVFALSCVWFYFVLLISIVSLALTTITQVTPHYRAYYTTR